MSKTSKTIPGAPVALLALLGLTLAGCASAPGTTMLVFGQTQTVGISVGGSVPDQGAMFTLGYQDRNFAIGPATVAQAGGGATQVLSSVPDADGRPATDALSVLGQFEVRSGSDGSGKVDVGLGKFFATGLAAQKLADGFKARIAVSASAASAASAAR